MAVRVAFAGDRDIAVWVLDHLLATGCAPVALLLPGERRATHAAALLERCPQLDPALIFRGTAFRSCAAIERLRALEIDILLSVHFPYLVPPEVLELPKRAALNLHPSYLPYNRGWHTPSWAILEDTPAGATLHHMAEAVDAGDIVHQARLPIGPGDTAHTLYRRLKQLELDVFREAWPQVLAGTAPRIRQVESGTVHDRAELLRPEVQRIDLAECVSAERLLRRLRALSTDRIEEAAFYEVDGRRFRVQVRIEAEEAPPPAPAG